MARHRKQDLDHGRPPGRARALSAVSTDVVEGRPTVRIVGRVEADTIAEVSAAVGGLLATGVVELTVDLGHCREATDLLEVLSRIRADLADLGGSLHLLGVTPPAFLTSLVTAPLDQLFLVYDAVRREEVRPPLARGGVTTPAVATVRTNVLAAS